MAKAHALWVPQVRSSFLLVLFICFAKSVKLVLCFSCRHRRDREAKILKSIENGACSMFDIISDVYGDVDKKFWILASSNVRLHVDYLNHQNKLPKVSLAISFKSELMLLRMNRQKMHLHKTGKSFDISNYAGFFVRTVQYKS